MTPMYEKAVEEFLSQFEQVDAESQKEWDEAIQSMNKDFEENFDEWVKEDNIKKSKIAEMARRVFLR